MRVSLSEAALGLFLVALLWLGWVSYQEEQRAAMACRRAGGSWTKVGEDLVWYPDGRGGLIPSWISRMGCVQ